MNAFLLHETPQQGHGGLTAMVGDEGEVASPPPVLLRWLKEGFWAWEP